MSLERLATELKQAIIGFLDLMSLVNVRNTNKNLHHLVNDALTQPSIIHTARANLLRLYLDLHRYPSFHESRKHILPHLIPFSRQQYLNKFKTEISKHCPKAQIPEEYELWIKEWPEKAVIGWAWPGLDSIFDIAAGKRGENRHWWRTYGGNMLHCSTNELTFDTLLFGSKDEVEGIFVQSHGCTLYSVLYFNCGSLRDGTVWSGGDICGIEEVDDWQGSPYVEKSWVGWLRRELGAIEKQY